MRLIVISFLVLSLAPAAGWTQQYELGGLGGFGVPKGLTAEAGGASADTGFQSGGAWGVVGTDNMYSRISGEFRYLFRWSKLRVASGGQEATFGGRSHIVHYDFLFHTKLRENKTRPFIAVGAGIKVFAGTGVERAFQPLSQFVLLTKKREMQPLISVGGGVKWHFRNHLSVRVEVRDYVTPPPKEVLVPAPGARITGWLHDIVPLVGLSYTF